MWSLLMTIKASGHGTNILDVGREAAEADARSPQPVKPATRENTPEPDTETEASEKEKPADSDDKTAAEAKPAEKPESTPEPTPKK